MATLTDLKGRLAAAEAAQYLALTGREWVRNLSPFVTSVLINACAALVTIVEQQCFDASVAAEEDWEDEQAWERERRFEARIAAGEQIAWEEDWDDHPEETMPQFEYDADTVQDHNLQEIVTELRVRQATLPRSVVELYDSYGAWVWKAVDDDVAYRLQFASPTSPSPRHNRPLPGFTWDRSIGDYAWTT